MRHNMIDFKEVELADKLWMDPLYAIANLGGCHHDFTNVFAWSGIYNHLVARVDDYIVVKVCNNDKVYYFYPAGHGDIQPVIEFMRQDAAENNQEFYFLGLTSENVAVLDSLFPGKFEYEGNIDYYDYVYLLDKLISLSGKKLQSKRNHINRFKKTYNWSFEEITTVNLKECWEMNVEWCIIHDCNEDDMLYKEKCAVTRCFENFTELELEGCLLRCDGKVVAYTMGEVLNSTTYVTHIEKAFTDIHGAYQMINHEFAVFIKEHHPDMHYVNREEDMGYDGLRRAKQSYYPDRMEEKYTARYRNK